MDLERASLSLQGHDKGLGKRSVAHGEADYEMSFKTREGLAFQLVGKEEAKESCKPQHDIIRFGFLQENA